MMKLLGRVLAALAFLAAAPAADARETRTVRVHFAPGASEATVQGRILGDGTANHRLGLRAGQMLRVELDSRSGAVEFNVFEPGAVPGRDMAVFRGSTGGRQMELRTARSGDYLIQVYLVRSAARRGERAAFTLRVAATGGEPAAPPARTGDALVPGTNFHATGTIACARAATGPMAQCRFGVTRSAGRGNGQVTVFWPRGGTRVIVFEDMTPVGFDESQADRGARMTVGRRGDRYDVRIGAQRFEIPEAVITGG